jgi:hypothetical protein
MRDAATSRARQNIAGTPLGRHDRGMGMEIGPQCAYHSSLQAIYEHWLSKRRGRQMPARGDLIIAELKQHLGWISLLDVLPGEDDFRYRLVGTRITLYFSADATGKTVREAFRLAPEAQEIMVALLRQTVQTKTPIRTFGSLAWLGRDLEDFESLFLPLSDDGKTVNCIMNPFVFDQSRVYLNRQVRSASQA